MYSLYSCLRKDTGVKRSWTQDEYAAVQRHLNKFFVMNQVPGKIDCQHFIATEPEALKHRKWTGSQ